ncbi:hypothetical protein LTS18_008046, partial [Coniosporium uncinatum]
MPLIQRKRRAPAVHDPFEDRSESPEIDQTQRRQRRRASETSEANGHEEDGNQQNDASGENIQQLSKKLIRLALACEYSRTPLKRADISAKVLGAQSRQFKA